MPNMWIWRQGRSQRPSPGFSPLVPRRPRSRAQGVWARRSRSASTAPLLATRARCTAPLIRARAARSAIDDQVDQILQAQHGGPAHYDEERRQDEEGQGEEHLDRQLAGALFRTLPALGAQQVGMRAQRLRHARAEPIALDDEARKRLQVLDAVAVAQPAERVLARPAAAQLEGDLRELPAEGVVYAGPLLADAGDGCIEAEAGLEAGDHEVEGVGKRAGELPHAPRDPHAQPEV